MVSQVYYNVKYFLAIVYLNLLSFFLNPNYQFRRLKPLTLEVKFKKTKRLYLKIYF